MSVQRIRAVSAARPASKRGVRALAPLAGVLAATLAGCGHTMTADNQSRSIFERFAPPTPAEAADWATDPFDPDRRQRGLLLLANAQWGGEPVYLRAYRAALEDEDPGVRASAVRALALHGSPEDALAIAAELDAEGRLLRWEAARALQRLHNPRVIDGLITRLDRTEEPDADVRAAAATALGQYARGRVYDALVAALDDPSLLVTHAASGSLETLTGEELGDDVDAWLALSAERQDLFANREAYVYPVFYRDRTVFEWVVPWLEPPNETSASPVGMPAVATGSVDAGPR